MASPTLVFNLSQVSNGSWSCRAASKLTSLTFASSQEGGHWPLEKSGEKLITNNLKITIFFNLIIYFIFN